MRAAKPVGTRLWEELSILLNMAIGEAVCSGSLLADGFYDMMLYGLRMCDAPPEGRWPRFERD